MLLMVFMIVTFIVVYGGCFYVRRRCRYERELQRTASQHRPTEEFIRGDLPPTYSNALINSRPARHGLAPSVTGIVNKSFVGDSFVSESSAGSLPTYEDALELANKRRGRQERGQTSGNVTFDLGDYDSQCAAYANENVPRSNDNQSEANRLKTDAQTQMGDISSFNKNFSRPRRTELRAAQSLNETILEEVEDENTDGANRVTGTVVTSCEPSSNIAESVAVSSSRDSSGRFVLSIRQSQPTVRSNNSLPIVRNDSAPF